MSLIAWLWGSLKTYQHCSRHSLRHRSEELLCSHKGCGDWSLCWTLAFTVTACERLLPCLQPNKGCNAWLRGRALKSKGPELKSWFSALSVWAWINCLTSLSLSLFIRKVGIGALPTSQAVAWIKWGGLPGEWPSMDVRTGNIGY